MKPVICCRTNNPFQISDFEIEYCAQNGVPLPTLHPNERLRDMFSFGSLTHLHRGVCSETGKKLLTFVAPEKGRKIIDVELWAKESWDQTQFGRPYDFTKSFFEQLFDLAKDVPLPNLEVSPQSLENSDFVHGVVGAKNCYLLFGASEGVDCLYSRYLFRSRDIMDCLIVFDCELCYDCVQIRNCYSLLCSENCEQCSDSAFLSNCRRCLNCFGCVNLATAHI